jgi:plastocyanin
VTRILLLLALCLTLGLAACGGDDDEEPAAPAETATEQPASGGAGAGDVVEIKMKDIQFDPADATVKVGQTVKWVNEDSVDHDVSADNGEFKSELFGQGGDFETKLDKAGTVPYVCTVHPNMKGTLTVTE